MRDAGRELDMVGRECLTLAEAVRLALEQSGDEALARPSLLLGFLMDYANQDSVELRALERNLDDGLLFSFREELARPEPDLCVAATRASTYLVDECVVREGEAKLVAEGIAEGVARWRGLDYVCDDWLKGESKDDLADDLADDLGTNEPDDPGPQLFHKKAQSVVTSLRHRALPDSFAAICAAVIIVVAVVTVALAAFAVRQRAQQSVASGLDPGQVAEEVGWDIEGPRSKPDSSMASGRVVMWDCVWFGSYPQREITPSYAVFESLETAKWDDNGDARVNGARYHRISRDDATHDKYWLDDGPAYRYFLWEPIKWRVLKVSGSRALVLADVALDARQYNAEYDDVTWETSSVRSWLNGYGADANQPNADYSRKGFCDVAFTESQRERRFSRPTSRTAITSSTALPAARTRMTRCSCLANPRSTAPVEKSTVSRRTARPLMRLGAVGRATMPAPWGRGGRPTAGSRTTAGGGSALRATMPAAPQTPMPTATCTVRASTLAAVTLASVRP